MSARDRILDSAADVMRASGLANTTTKEIASAARLSEATLYKVFHDGPTGACLHRAFLVRFAGETLTPARVRRFAAEVVTALDRCWDP